jgi:predicted Zn-dependent peptidase
LRGQGIVVAIDSDRFHTESLQRDCRVVLAGPTTLLAMLNSLQMGFRTLALEKRSSEVWQVLGAVKTEFGKFGEVLARIKTQVRAAEIYARDDAGDLANTYGAALAVGLSVQDVQDWPAALDAVTKADVVAAARAVFIPENSVTGWLETKAGP